MIWLTWRQQRLEIYLGVAMLALLAVLLLKTGSDMASAYQQTGVAACVGPHPATSCFTVIEAFRNRFSSMGTLAGWLNFLPLVFGLLFGAPFVLELEQGTFRLAWTQSITRTRWVAIKLGFIIALTVLVALTLTALLTWWRLPFDRLDGNFDPNTGFDFEGIVPLGYAVYAVAVGITCGTLIRKTVPAMGISIAAFLGLRLGILNFVRPHYLAPLKATTAFTSQGVPDAPHRGDWVLFGGYSDRLGHVLSDNVVFQRCNPDSGLAIKQSMFACFRSHHIYGLSIYQPASRFWLFQGIETAIFLGLSALLLGITIWWVRYRIT